ncbi:MAG: hypothetical protein LAN36_10770 [Acidobacteriia bacterium]|nr:hypothetical protein [Terriglobia bacterium]
MRLNSRRALRKSVFSVALLLGVIVIASPAANQRVRLAPRFTPGQTLRYRIESRSTTTGKTTTPIVNPESGTQSSQAIHLLVRLDVLDAQPTPAAGAVRLRATYEKSSAESETDAFDPDAASLGDQYARLEGHSIEFTMKPGGELGDFQGLEEVFTDRSAAEPVVSWLEVLSSGSGFPRDGISIGQKWSSERPLSGAPLSGLVWRTESAYLRNEPCNSSGSASECAVILTHFKILRRGSVHPDATPEDYRRNGLRTSGSWTGSGESLDSISLSTGLLVNSTQTSTQDVDYAITSASTGSSIHHKGRVESHSEIALLPNQM